jgi:hypothetical protein
LIIFLRYGISEAYIGIAFAGNGDPISMDCGTEAKLWRYDSSSTINVHGSNIHPSTPVILSQPLGCGLTNHPDGRVYGNDRINAIDANTFEHVLGPAGTAGGLYGISVVIIFYMKYF